VIEPIRVGRLWGVPIAVDWSWSIISVLMAGAFYVRVAPDDGPIWPALGVAAAGAGLLLASVVAHEVSHAAAARLRGIGVRTVTLFVFGGYTEMETEPASPRDEFLVAGSGPAASLVLGAVLWTFATWSSGAPAEVLELLGGINVAVAAFNLLPGLPLDGGRLLRSVVWHHTGDGDRASRIAAGVGQVLGVLIAAAAPAVLPSAGLLAAVAAVVVGWFLYRSASVIRRTSGRLATPVGELMAPASGWVAPDAVIADVADPATVLPIAVVEGERVVGTVEGPLSEGRSAGSVMTPLRRSDVVAATAPIGMVLAPLRRRRRPLVVVSEGRMVGVVSREQVERWLESPG
jgi:Zn-dependent protease